MAIKPLHNETELLAKVAGGDQRAFAELFRGYHQPLAKYIYSLLESVQLCEEIVQDVFVKIWQNRHELPEIEKFSAYLFILTRNYTLNCIRKITADRKKSVLYQESITDTTPDEEAISFEKEYQSLVERAIAQLPPSQQQVFIAKQQGLKTREIAEKMGITTDSAKKYHQWAMHFIAEFVKTHASLGIFFGLIKF